MSAAMLITACTLVAGAAACVVLYRSVKRPAMVVVDEPGPEGPPPVPWISDHVWRTSREWTRFIGLKGPGGPLTRLDIDAQPVEDDARASVPRLHPTALRPCPVGAVEEHQKRLETTPNVGAWWNPAPWPVCCERLACMVATNPRTAELAALESEAGSLGTASLYPHAADSWDSELDGIRRGGEAENGVNLFQCSDCGRFYGVLSHT